MPEFMKPVVAVALAAGAALAGCGSIPDRSSAPDEPEPAATISSEADLAGEAESGALSVSVALGKPGGRVMASLVRGPEGWANNDPVEIFEIAADQSPVTFAATGLTPGAYGLKLFQDTDGNGALSTNALGIPTEPYAFSNNAAGTFGAPGFEAAAFEIVSGGEAIQNISLD